MKINNLVFCFIVILSHIVFVVAQDAGKPSLEGRIMDTTGAVAPGMKIIIRDKKGKTFEDLTDADGFYSIKLTTGEYLIEVQENGGLFGIKVENYKIAPTKMRLDIVLEIDGNAPTTAGPSRRKRNHKENIIRFLKQ